MKNRSLKYIVGALLTCAIFMVTGCAGTRVAVEHGQGPPADGERKYERPGRSGGPPPWAPAHGYRAKKYRYYPSAQVYYDTGRGVYFYYTKGSWEVSASLPNRLKMRISDDYITLEMDTENPYEYHSQVVEKYPPGLNKNRGRGKDKKGPPDY